MHILDDETVKKLLEIAKDKTLIDGEGWDFESYDDAYYRGLDDGSTILARGILEKMGISYK